MKTAESHTLRPSGHCDIIAPTCDTQAMRLHLVDLDNLHNGTRPTEQGMRLVRRNYARLGYGPTDLGYAAFNHAPQRRPSAAQSRAFQLQQLWSPFQVRPAQGPDGADNRLIDDAEAFLWMGNPRERFSDVIIGSGDHIFAPMARRFRDQGLTVHVVVASQKSLAHELRAVVNGCIWLLPTGRCLRHMRHPTTN